MRYVRSRSTTRRPFAVSIELSFVLLAASVGAGAGVEALLTTSSAADGGL